MMSDRVDVLIIGAGLSGIDAAYRLQTESPDRRYLILEGRDAIGGTWDLFRYPGVRSDSDMFTLGYPFRPWRQPKSIAAGETILSYVRDTAARFGIDQHVRYGQRVVAASWSTPEATWTVRTESGKEYQSSFLFLCTGYYRYSAGFSPRFAGQEDFTGAIVHPQHWPAGLSYEGKRVVVIGSGATAVTLVPAMAETAEHVTMLQRSPSYMISLPTAADDGSDLSLARSRLNRSRNILATALLYQAARHFPARVSAFLRRGVAQQLPPGGSVDRDFTPRYAPWDQRLCVVPDGDLFAAMREDRASVVTGTIETFTEKGIRLTDGTDLEADIIVTATGLTMVTLGEIALDVDGRAVHSGDLHVYKGMMFDGLPNLAWCVGYINASWTLRADLTARYVCRLLNYMKRHRIDTVTPSRPPGASAGGDPLMALSSGYVERATAILPKQGSRTPWRLRNNYLTDMPAMRFGRINDGHVTFTRVQR
jgi:monooxygenase